MQDIAQVSGYSITTICHVINRTRHVDAEARSIILKAAESLGYNFNRNNASDKNKTIGMVIADIRVDYFSDVTKSVEEIARSAGYNLIYCDSAERDEDERVCIDMLLAHGVSGMILAPCNTDADYSRLIEQQVPVVLLDRNIDSRKFDFVGIDNANSATRLTKCLWNQGSRDIGFVGYKGPQFTTRERIEGYRNALLELGIFDPKRILLIDSHADNVGQELADFVTQRNKLDGIICQSSNASFDILDTLTELGSEYAERIRLGTWDDNKWFNLLKYPISAISQPTGDIAAVATELLFDKIESSKRQTIPKRIFLDYELTVRP
jgi:DNA-binding LacI/PurR family transcriptional regulator